MFAFEAYSYKVWSVLFNKVVLGTGYPTNEYSLGLPQLASASSLSRLGPHLQQTVQVNLKIPRTLYIMPKVSICESSPASAVPLRPTHKAGRQLDRCQPALTVLAHAAIRRAGGVEANLRPGRLVVLALSS